MKDPLNTTIIAWNIMKERFSGTSSKPSFDEKI